MDTISVNTGSPPKGYTDSQWQQDFQRLKEKVEPSSEKEMNVPVDSCPPGQAYHGRTQYQCFCQMINDILANIRHGGTDYCFYIYQVAELLKYEHERLEVRWLNNEKCFLVRLKTKQEK